MPAQKRSNDSLYEDEDDVELQRNYQDTSEESEESDVEQEEQESDDDGSLSSSWSDQDEFVFVNVADLRKDVQCPICLGIIRKTRKVMECLHRFCRECIDKSMRMGNNECPACRAHCASRRSLRDDLNFDAIVAMLYPDIDKYETEELAIHEEEEARNKQIQASITQTSRRQLEALGGKKRATAKATAIAVTRRSQGSTCNLRGKRSRKSSEPQSSVNEVNDDNDLGGKYSSSIDEPSTEPRLKRYKRSNGGNGGCDDNEAETNRKSVGSEMLAWGRGGIRSHTRHGGQSSSSKGARNSQLSKIIDHVRNLPQNDDELAIHLKLVSLDEQNIPNLQKLHICCTSIMSTTHLRQYIAAEIGFQANELELLLVKEDYSELDVMNPSMDGMVPLEEHQIMLDVNKISSQNNLIIAYRKKAKAC